MSGEAKSASGGAKLAPLNPNGPWHRPLTPLKVLRGVLCLLVYLSTALMMIVYCAPFATSFLRLFSVNCSRKATAVLFGTWLSMWPFLFEKVNKTKVVFSGQCVPREGRVLLFANHTTEVDWMYLWDLALRKGQLGSIKYILKRSLMKLPVFGWGFHISEFIPVERKWEVDEPLLRKKLSSFNNRRDPLWLAVFPEGTDYTEQKCIRSQHYAAQNGLPILKNVLLPKTRGFCACLEALKNSLDAVYDITIAYKYQCPTFMDNVFGVGPCEVHINVERIMLHEVPASDTEVAAWLIDRFKLKDKLLTDFAAQGCFPNQVKEKDLCMVEGLVKISAVLSLTCLLMYLTLFSSVWFRVYVVLSCTYLSLVTYFGVHPPPIFGSLKTLVVGEKNL